ncbi:helix-turn-helix domain-containing protein [Streptomyces sp. 2112.2]|uniref:helix-turn-helix domain-containing protein n=1 Tax=Streptomyces sp. 2112.2 TaxID=1881024 RepID=UPI003523DB42
MDLDAAAAELDCHRSRLSRIENGRGGAVAKPSDVEKLLELYGVQDSTRLARLLALLNDSQKPGWWESLELPPGLDALVGLETDARKESTFEPLLVPGPLQTPHYARAVINAARTHRPDDVEDLVQLREGRLQLLTRSDNPLEMWAVIDENIIRRPIGGAETRRQQLRHLLELGALPNVTLQLVPFEKESHPGLGGSFSLLEFEDDPAVVYVDSMAGNLYLEKERDVRRFVRAFDLLKAHALDPDDSAARIDRAAKESTP